MRTRGPDKIIRNLDTLHNCLLLPIAQDKVITFYILSHARFPNNLDKNLYINTFLRVAVMEKFSRFLPKKKKFQGCDNHILVEIISSSLLFITVHRQRLHAIKLTWERYMPTWTYDVILEKISSFSYRKFLAENIFEMAGKFKGSRALTWLRMQSCVWGKKACL